MRRNFYEMRNSVDFPVGRELLKIIVTKQVCKYGVDVYTLQYYTILYLRNTHQNMIMKNYN